MDTLQDHQQRALAICDRIVDKLTNNEPIDVKKLIQCIDNSPISEFYSAYDIVREFCTEVNINIGAPIPVVAPPIGLATADVSLSRIRMKVVVENYLKEVEAHHKQKMNTTWLNATNDKTRNLYAALKVGVGIGKTKTAQDCISDYIKNAKQAGVPHRVLWLVPSHKLSKDTCADFVRLDVSVEVWRGREAIDPNNKPNKMCIEYEACNEATKAGVDPDKVVCGNKKLGFCPFYNKCAYREQKIQCAKADVLIAAHNFLFIALKNIISDIGVVVIDESFWQKAVVKPKNIVISSLASDVKNMPVLENNGDLMISANKELYDLSADLETVTKSMAIGEYLSDHHLIGFNKDYVVNAIKFEWKRKIKVIMYPNMTIADRRAEANRVSCNKSIVRRVEMWKVVLGLIENRPGYEGRLQRSSRAFDGGSVETLTLRTHKEVLNSIKTLPILVLDATYPERLVKELIGGMNMISNVRAKTPAMNVTQILGTIDQNKKLPRGGFGKTTLDYSQSGVEVHQLQKRLRKCDAIKTFIQREVGSGTGLVVCNQVIEPHFNNITGIKTEHFNNVVGIDGYKDVDCVFVIGRPLPDSIGLHEIARSMFGYNIDDSKASLKVSSVLMADGNGSNVMRWQYDNSDVEYVKQAITDAEVIQAVGRGRGVTPGRKPLKVFVLGDAELDVPVNELLVWRDIKADCIDKMFIEGIVLFSPVDAFAMYPNIFKNEDVAKMALKRAGNVAVLGVQVEYRVNGVGKVAAARRAVVASQDDKDKLKIWLEAKYGQLKVFK
jgi:hypothetical protein